jgi:uncharacterized protein GlcG (DUF336 family)
MKSWFRRPSSPQSSLRRGKLAFERLETRQLLSLPAAAPDPKLSLTPGDVDLLLRRAVAGSSRTDAIIAVVDRNGTILGVQVESGVSIADPNTLYFAIDGAVAEARTGAFFSSNGLPGSVPIDLTSRTIRQISQTTITQREVQANPDPSETDPTKQGPGFVAPIGIGGQFPAGINNTPLVDLFEIEGTNRAVVSNGTAYNAGGNIAQPIPSPVAYGVQSGLSTSDIGRGIGTLPGGIGIFEKDPSNHNQPVLVGGIGVFFPGTTGYSDFEQGFNPANPKQTALQRENSPLALEAEWMAFAAIGGAPAVGAGVGALPTSNGPAVPAATGFLVPLSRNFKIFLAGITLDQVGKGSAGGVNQTLQTGKKSGHGVFIAPTLGSNQIVVPGMTEIPGLPVSTGILVTPHDGVGLTAAQVEQIIQQGIDTANKTRAQIRTPTTQMVFAVADSTGEVLGLYRMTDATIFSIDVSVAKARNVAYYASGDLQNFDRVPVNDLLPVSASNPYLPLGTAFTNRTFRFLADPRYPEGVNGTVAGDFSILREDWVNPENGYNLGAPAPISDMNTVLGYDAFHPGTNFHDPTDPNNQNGVVFFPGSSVVFVNGSLVGGFGVSGDGVDQDDVVTFFGIKGFAAPGAITADQFKVRGVRLPYQQFSRNAFRT